jgi:hypothetical protein
MVLLHHSPSHIHGEKPPRIVLTFVVVYAVMLNELPTQKCQHHHSYRR